MAAKHVCGCGLSCVELQGGVEALVMAHAISWRVHMRRVPEGIHIELGPKQMAECKTPVKRAKMIGDLALILGRSCHDCETGHAEETPQ
jgi:hypothetical protein